MKVIIIVLHAKRWRCYFVDKVCIFFPDSTNRLQIRCKILYAPHPWTPQANLKVRCLKNLHLPEP